MAFRVFADSRDGVIRRLLLLSALFLSTICVVIWSTGGFATVVLGVRVSARSPQPPAAGAAIALVLWVLAAWRARAMPADLARVEEWIDRRATVIIGAFAAVAGGIAARYHTFSASGADPSGYLSEAAMLASGALSYTEPLVSLARWEDARRTLAPLGWQAVQGAMQVPTYAVGLPLLMALPHALAGTIGASLVVCVSAALATWFAGRTATALAGGAAGVFAAVSLATLPVQLYQSMQPMSDVPVTAAWLACWWWMSSIVMEGAGPVAGTAGPVAGIATMARTGAVAGIAAALAVLIRPNLAPLAAVPALCLWLRAPARQRNALALCFALPVALAAGVVAYLQWRWFGSALRSGYGSALEIYSLANIGLNVRLYGEWLLETNGGWLLAAPLALAVRSRPVLRWLLAFAALVMISYFMYGPFEGWPYLRFLLPALALACIATAVVAGRGRLQLPSPPHPLLMIALTLAIGGLQIKTARGLGIFTLAPRQARAVLAGHYLASASGRHAVFITGEQSGAMRYYTGRSIVRWDFVGPDTLAQVERRLHDHGREIWIVLDDWEVALFRDKFQSMSLGGLDWPPVMDAGSIGRTQAWRLSDRPRFLTGSRVTTDRFR